MSKRTLHKVSIAVPLPVLQWMNDESKAVGMTRNAFITMKFMLMKETQHGERLRRLETRVAQIEQKISL